ncbi:O-methyltransferase [Pontimicrobium sp. IMCC45349]|uniref:O-methyltransferase n=1 Tax=Pontimicrobium sp. IMCC45349 TaxID=3391574 RepID=UPI0039A2BD0D
MLYAITSYISFLLKSTNQHGVHSPFVYNFVTKCLYDKKKYDSYVFLKKYRIALLNNKSSIEITDFGAGSKKFNTNKRQINKLAKNVGTTSKRAKLLFRLTSYFKSNTILELGTSLGIATQAMSLGNPKAQITTIEGCPNLNSFTKKQFKQNQLKNINALNGNFSDVLNNLTNNSYDLIFFDGNHQKEATLNYFEKLLTTAHNDSVFVFDDIYWSKDMTEAWETIKQHPKVTVTIDTYFWGFVFFRKEQQKEHFTIRV